MKLIAHEFLYNPDPMKYNGELNVFLGTDDKIKLVKIPYNEPDNIEFMAASHCNPIKMIKCAINDGYKLNFAFGEDEYESLPQDRIDDLMDEVGYNREIIIFESSLIPSEPLPGFNAIPELDLNGNNGYSGFGIDSVILAMRAAISQGYKIIHITDDSRRIGTDEKRLLERVTEIKIKEPETADALF